MESGVEVRQETRNDALRISSVYDSIQGEGIRIGKPCVMLKLQGCNLNCIWCDAANLIPCTGEGVEWKVVELVSEEVQRFSRHELVITGGEPMLQQEALFSLLKRLSAWHVTVETNGTILPRSYGIARRVNLWSLSPKLISSGHEHPTENVRAWVERYGSRMQLKYVVRDDADYTELVDHLSTIGRERLGLTRVVLQPEWSNWEFIASLVERVGVEPFWDGVSVRVLPQLQKLIWGETHDGHQHQGLCGATRRVEAVSDT